MTKKAKLITIITSAVVAVALIVTAICLIVANANRKKEYELREKTATSIMTCETNPSVQFVLNGNDKVMRVVALNNDGKALELNGEFIGLTAEDAAELFVKITTKAGKISLDITASGTTVTITFSGSKQDYSEMSKSVVNKVNKFFDENGIIAGAKSQIEELKESVKRLKPTASNVDTKTLDELFTQYDNIANLVSKVIPDNMASFYAKYDELNAEYLKKEAEINSYIKQWKDAIALLPKGSDEIAKLNAKITSTQKTLSDYYDFFVNQVNDALPSAEILQNALNTLKAQFEQKINDFKATFDAHKTEFENNKTEFEQKIKEFRDSLNQN